MPFTIFNLAGQKRSLHPLYEQRNCVRVHRPKGIWRFFLFNELNFHLIFMHNALTDFSAFGGGFWALRVHVAFCIGVPSRNNCYNHLHPRDEGKKLGDRRDSLKCNPNFKARTSGAVWLISFVFYSYSNIIIFGTAYYSCEYSRDIRVVWNWTIKLSTNFTN